ncbi:MAG: hypothetical protein JWO26_1841 [Rhodospirillales bacterium]|jgi:uncharacterized metal-binding protein YceD (DUF177 family)|nr:hypothetical protein [Rhodospirillales bacterium]MDB5382209.1 hypothetical protein [Rhodospirillales bacterium]
MNPEFSRPLAVARIGPPGRRERFAASAAECAALAERFGIPAIDKLEAELSLAPAKGGAVAAEGWLRAEVVQSCVVTLDPVPESLDIPLRLRFIPEGDEPSDDPDTPDEIEIEAGMIDLGEAVAEQLSLALNPYPRAPGAQLPPELEPSPEPEPEPAKIHPFAALKAPREKP